MPDKPSLQELAKLDRRTIDPGLLRDEGGWPDSAGACLYASVVAVVLLRRFGGVYAILRGGGEGKGALDAQGCWQAHYWAEATDRASTAGVVDVTAD